MMTTNGPLDKRDKIVENLRNVIDPELGVNIVDLGLVYQVQVSDDGKSVRVEFSTTTPGCPMRRYLPLILLHGFLAVRIAGDMLGFYSIRAIGSYGNMAAILLFLGGIPVQLFRNKTR